jgi:hypothetical protein
MQRVDETPTRSEHIVPSTPKTPRRILKQSAQPSKKRRVAFSSEKSKSYSSDEDDKAFKVKFNTIQSWNATQSVPV